MDIAKEHDKWRIFDLFNHITMCLCTSIKNLQLGRPKGANERWKQSINYEINRERERERKYLKIVIYSYTWDCTSECLYFMEYDLCGYACDAIERTLYQGEKCVCVCVRIKSAIISLLSRASNDINRKCMVEHLGMAE